MNSKQVNIFNLLKKIQVIRDQLFKAHATQQSLAASLQQPHFLGAQAYFQTKFRPSKQV